MRFARPATKIAVLAVVGVTALAACAAAAAAPSSQQAGPSGAFGTVPAASGTAHAGHGDRRRAAGATPTWILPITPGANSSVYTAYSFQYQMWRPLYCFVNGVKPVETPSMSLASRPRVQQRRQDRHDQHEDN